MFFDHISFPVFESFVMNVVNKNMASLQFQKSVIKVIIKYLLLTNIYTQIKEIIVNRINKNMKVH